MVIFLNPDPSNSMRLALVKGSWSTSLRNSFRKRVITDSSPKKGAKENRDDTVSPKEVTFDDDHLFTVIPETSEPVTDEEMTKCWCQRHEFTSFAKDRVLTAMEYINSRRIGTHYFDEKKHSIRGIEPFYDPKLRRRQIGERKDLTKALKAETGRQKEAGVFPDLNDFYAVSSKHTKPARDRAHSLAQEDARQCRPKGFIIPVVNAISRRHWP